MRDRLVHHYFGVKLDTVWKTAIEDLPDLVEMVGPLISQLEHEGL